MGVVAQARCGKCGYQSKPLFLGSGRSGEVNAVAVCRVCGIVMTRDQNELTSGQAVCSRCEGPLERLALNVSGNLSGTFHCPHCGVRSLTFSSSGRWD